LNAKRNAIIYGLIVSFLIAVTSGVYWRYSQINALAPEIASGEFEFTIQPGMSINQIINQLNDENLIHDTKSFRWAARILGADRKLQPGIFSLPRGATNGEILSILMQPGINTKNVTIPEGLTCWQIAGILQKELGIDSSEFIDLCENSDFAKDLGIKANRLEGYLFPSTYNFYRNSSSAQLINRMVKQFKEEFNNDIQTSAEKLGFSAHETMTMASIIQGEVMVWDEARTVSSVYHNRLRIRMHLGADPTIQYVIPGPPRRLLNKDIAIDSPYNTYRNYGLPPGPINNPGRRALKAAVNPADTDFIYFVARGDGSHSFNKTIAGHEKDKKKFQQVRREARRKKRKG
jgi:UPF0755 protein